MAAFVFLLPLALQTATPVAVAASETAAPVKPAAKEKLICKRRVKTGSLAGYERSCHTKAEWQRISDSTRETWQELQGTKGSTHGG